ncbi:MAG: OsmC family protein [Immundisolibacteraceae bacterium]|nr:OsmC family protein [Immundisolibacteraceae bacterium]
MEKLPHSYAVTVKGDQQGNLHASGAGLPPLVCAPPTQFDGPGDQWSPEELLMAAVANCLVLSFRAIAGASRYEWNSIECDARGVLDQVDRKIQITTIENLVTLVVPAGSDAAKAEKLLEKAEQACFISNSLTAEVQLKCEIVIAG